MGMLFLCLADNYFFFKVEDVLQEFTSRLVEPGPMLMGPDNAETSRSIARRFKCFDTYELDDIGMSRLMVESLLTQSFLQKIETRFSHIEDYELVSGACLFMMALEACNANESVDIEGAKTAFAALDINAYKGQNVSEFITEAMRLIKIMAGDYALDTHLGSKLLTKLSATDQVYFNRMMFNLLDEVKPFERSYKHKNPKLKEMDPRFKTLGPLALCGKIHETYAHLGADKDWTQLQSRPEVNLGGILACFHCGGPHLKRDCPTLGQDGNDRAPNDRPTGTPPSGNAGGTSGGNSNRPNPPVNPPTGTSGAATAVRCLKAAWKYLAPSDENQLIEAPAVLTEAGEVVTEAQT
jgi:hypothetical protein